MRKQSYRTEYPSLSNNWLELHYIGLVVTVVCNFLILLGHPLRVGRLISYGTRVLVICIFVIAVLQVLAALRKRLVTHVEFLYLALIALTVMSGLFSGWRYLVFNIVKYMCFLMVPAYFVVYKDVEYLGYLRRVIYVGNFIYTALYTYLYFSPYSHVFYTVWGNADIDELTLGYNNPNETAIYLLCSFIIMWSAMRDAEQRGKGKLLYLICCGWLYYLIFETRCRAGILLVLVFVLLDLLSPVKKVGKNQLLLAVLMPAISGILMLSFPVFFKNLILLGEAADTGRYLLYQAFLKLLSLREFIVGDYARFAGQNFHNSYLSLLCIFGIGTTVLYIIFLFRTLLHYSKRVNDRASYVGYIGAIALILHGIAEGTLLISGTIYAGMFGLVILLMIPEKPHGEAEEIAVSTHPAEETAEQNAEETP